MYQGFDLQTRMPIKVEVLKMLDRVSPEGKAIGAINTIVPERNTQNGIVELVGTNS